MDMKTGKATEADILAGLPNRDGRETAFPLRRPTVKMLQAAPELEAACEWAARSYHHPVCGVAKQTSMICSCHVGAAKAALDLARG